MSEQEFADFQREQLDEMLSHIENLMADELYDKAQDVLNHALKLDLFDIRVYQRYAFVLRMTGQAEPAELFEKVAMNPGDPEGYYELAQALIKQNQYGSAINPLRKVVELVPMATNAIFELGYAYLKEHNMAEARAHFEVAHELNPTINTGFYIGYAALLSGDPAAASQHFPFMEAEYAKVGERPYMVQLLTEMITRYEAFPPKTVRDWHFVQYGTPLLRLSEEDLGEANEHLNGRYVFINYGFMNIAIVLQTFKRLIEEVPGFPQFRYIVGASPKTAPMAFAFSEMTGIPLANPDIIKTDVPGILFTSWTDEVEAVAKHIAGNPACMLFAHSMGWTLQAPLCPEVVGYLDQANRLPWEGTIEMLENGERRHRLPMTEPPEVVGYHILERVEKTPTEEIDKIVAYYKERAHLLKVGENANWPRIGFQIESPIESIRMMV